MLQTQKNINNIVGGTQNTFLCNTVLQMRSALRSHIIFLIFNLILIPFIYNRLISVEIADPLYILLLLVPDDTLMTICRFLAGATFTSIIDLMKIVAIYISHHIKEILLDIQCLVLEID